MFPNPILLGLLALPAALCLPGAVQVNFVVDEAEVSCPPSTLHKSRDGITQLSRLMPALHQTSLSGLENKGPTETVHNFDTVRYDFPHTSWTFDDDTKVYGFPLELRGPGLKKTLNHSVVAADLKDNSLLLVKLPFDPGCNEIWFTLGILGDPEKKGSPFLKGNINIHYESKSYDGDWQETDTQFTTDASAPTLIKIRNSFGQNGTFDTTAFRIAFGPGGSSAEGLGVLTEFTTFSVPHPEGFMYEL